MPSSTSSSLTPACACCGRDSVRTVPLRSRDDVAELTRGGQLIAASTFKNMTVFTLVALLYLTMSLPLTYLAHRLERRFGRR